MIPPTTLGQGFPIQPNIHPSMLTGMGTITQQVSSETTLYVGNLSPTTDDSRLHAIFSPHGKIMTARVMYDAFSQESRRFGFVSFERIEEAQKAKDTLNYQKIENFEIRICFKKLNSDFKEGGNLFVKNISTDVTAKSIDELFSKHGKVVSCSIRTDKNGKSLGYGYVQYENEESAVAAIEKLHETTVFGQTILVLKFVSAKNREIKKNNVYFKNFPKSWNKEKVEEQTKKMFAEFGEITSFGIFGKEFVENDVKIMSYYGFSAFSNDEDCKKAIDALNGKALEGAQEDEGPFYVCFAETKNQRKERIRKENSTTPNTTNLYIKSLLETVTEEKLREVFKKYGVITSICLKECQPPFVPNGQILKTGFMNFKTSEMAQEALIGSKKDADVKELIHPAHSRTIEFIGYFQSKQIRAGFKKMQMNLRYSKVFEDYNRQMMTGMQPKYKGQMPFIPPFPYGQQNPMVGYMGMPFGNRGPRVHDRNMQGINSTTPPTNKNSNSSSTSRQGEDEEMFNLEYLKVHKDEFLTYDKERQNNILGNLMYHKVMESGLSNKELAPKITGMLIDLEILDIAEIIEIMENKESLNERVNEALEVINSNED